jgi:hypothetical protein
MKGVKNIESKRGALAERQALRWGIFSALISAAIAGAWFLGNGVSAVPITGDLSIARASVYLGVVACVMLFVYYYRAGERWMNQNAKQPLPKKWVFWRDSLTLAFAYGLVVLATMALAAFVFSNAFIGLELDPYSSALLVGVAVGVSAYVVTNLAFTVSVNRILAVLGIVLVGGVLFAMVTNGQADWWQVHFSYLGMAQSEAAKAFNFTLIFSGLVMLSLTENLFNALAPAFEGGESKMRFNVIKGAFVFIAIALACVGIFPFVEGSIKATLHNASAYGMVLGFLFLISTLRWTSPRLSPEFFILSYIMGGSLIVCFILFNFVGYLNLTAFELLSFGISFTWLMLYLRNLSQLSERGK